VYFDQWFTPILDTLEDFCAPNIFAEFNVNPGGLGGGGSLWVPCTKGTCKLSNSPVDNWRYLGNADVNDLING
jgi:hypothetical protein